MRLLQLRRAVYHGRGVVEEPYFENKCCFEVGIEIESLKLLVTVTRLYENTTFSEKTLLHVILRFNRLPGSGTVTVIEGKGFIHVRMTIRG